MSRGYRRFRHRAVCGYIDTVTSGVDAAHQNIRKEQV